MTVAQIIPLADAWGMHGDVGWGWMAAMMIFIVLFWGAVIFGILWLVRGTTSGGSGRSSRSEQQRQSPQDILDRRFAEGAISEEDYRARRDVLLGGSTGSNGARKDEVVVAP